MHLAHASAVQHQPEVVAAKAGKRCGQERIISVIIFGLFFCEKSGNLSFLRTGELS